MTRIGDLDESSLLARILPILPRGTATLLGSGDDAAVIGAPNGRYCVSVDVLVENHHFRRQWASGYDIGVRAGVQNLADIAAMGAVPTAMVVGLVLPPDLEVLWLDSFARGLAHSCGETVGVVGGDLSAGEAIVVSVTVHGDLEGREPVCRSGARVGDEVGHAGVLGHSAAGLAALQAGKQNQFGDLVKAHLRPHCPLAAGPQAAKAQASAMLDVSDGLAIDAGRIARASGVTIALAGDKLSSYEQLLAAAGGCLGVTPREWVLAGGEDHGLLATFPPGHLAPGFTKIGTVMAAGTHAVTVAGEPVTYTGWDHFRP